jgi:hypothetical protein
MALGHKLGARSENHKAAARHGEFLLGKSAHQLPRNGQLTKLVLFAVDSAQNIGRMRFGTAVHTRGILAGFAAYGGHRSAAVGGYRDPGARDIAQSDRLDAACRFGAECVFGRLPPSAP